MKQAFFACLILTLSVTTLFGQSSPIVIDNATGCDFIVDLIQQDPQTCKEKCWISNICVPAGSTISVNPCCSQCVWLVGLVTPADAPCRPCTANYVKVYEVNNPCNNTPSTGTYNHCSPGCGTYNLNWNNPAALKIF
mgnify:CR=1 FL=1